MKGKPREKEAFKISDCPGDLHRNNPLEGAYSLASSEVETDF